MEKSGFGKSDYHFVFAGDGNTEDLLQIKKELLEKGLLDRVTFPGWVRGDQKEILLKESSIFLFPSYHEGMPMAVLEAMANGLAVLTTGVGGIPRLIQNGENGLLCKAGDIDKLAESLCYLMKKEESTYEYGQRAREKIIACYSRERHIMKLTEYYRELKGDGQAWSESV